MHHFKINGKMVSSFSFSSFPAHMPLPLPGPDRWLICWRFATKGTQKLLGWNVCCRTALLYLEFSVFLGAETVSDPAKYRFLSQF